MSKPTRIEALQCLAAGYVIDSYYDVVDADPDLRARLITLMESLQAKADDRPMREVIEIAFPAELGA